MLLIVSGIVCGLVAAAVCAGVSTIDQALAASSAAVACTLAAAVGLVPVTLLATSRPEGAGLGFLLGTLLRLGLSMFSVILLNQLADLPLMPVAGWTAAWYLVLLVIEVSLIVRYLNDRHALPHTAAVKESRPR